MTVMIVYFVWKKEKKTYFHSLQMRNLDLPELNQALWTYFPVQKFLRFIPVAFKPYLHQDHLEGLLKQVLNFGPRVTWSLICISHKFPGDRIRPKLWEALICILQTTFSRCLFTGKFSLFSKDVFLKCYNLL